MYLIHAEADVRLGNFARAEHIFTQFQKTRDPQYVSKGNQGEALITEIMNSRRIELWRESFRILDLKRLNQPIKRGSNFEIRFCGFLEKNTNASDLGTTLTT